MSQDRQIVYSVVHLRAVRLWRDSVVRDSILLRGPLRRFKINVLCFFGMSGICYPVTQHRSPGELSPRVI